ncbi:MAG: EAL domain-containing protein, partial [Actinomycetota bacterium]|nr:EAL domain-containing protein [Actinomycetota bacterium]
RRALDRGEIQPFFRPEFDVEEGRLIGAEIVARWIREDGSILDERELLTVARDANTVERLAVAVVREARPFLRRLELFGLPTNFRFRIDLPHRCTPRAWRDGQIAAAFVGLDMSRLTLDATAEVVAVDPVHAAELLADLRNRGAQVSLRDLSDLEVLGSIAVDEIRLARSVVRGRRPIDDALLGAVADLAHDLGLQLGAGDVTSIDESHRLVDHGCHRQSGPLFGLPITAEDLAELVEKDLVSHLSSTSMP